MKILSKKIYLLPFAAATLGLSSCMDEIEPQSDTASTNQLSQDSESFSKLVVGLKTKMTQAYTYGGTSSEYTGSTTAAAADWGYPCYMHMRDVLLDGMPTNGSEYNYVYKMEACTNLTDYSGYPYYYYYNFINNCNRIIKARQEEGSPESICQQLAIARTYRALSYMHLAMMYEFYNTGYEDLDEKAKNSGVLGLTVPLVTESTTNDEAKNNPRAPFYKMYRFIYNDLSIAEANIANYSRSDYNDINIDVVNVLMARFWMILGSRFERNRTDLSTQVQHESDNDGYKALGITTAKDCFAKAAAYADKVIAAGYSPMTKSEWQSPQTGFNTATTAWIWDLKYSSTELTPRYWLTLTGRYSSEAKWALPAYTGEYRCISSALFEKIGDSDFRKISWVAPEDAGSHTVPAKYQTTLQDSTAATTSDRTSWHRLPAYANLKFRPANGNITGEEEDGLLVSIPLMRVEEMYFIKAEAALHTNGLSTAKQELESFMNSYRYEDNSYTCEASSANDFIKELMAQKYIEFWGEDIMYNDYKRLGLQIDRKYEGTNYGTAYQMRSKDGYTAPWLNFYISDTERSFNQGIVMNPDPTTYITKYCK